MNSSTWVVGGKKEEGVEVRSSLPYILAKWPEAIKKRSCFFFFSRFCYTMFACMPELCCQENLFILAKQLLVCFFIFTSMMHSSTLETRGGDH